MSTLDKAPSSLVPTTDLPPLTTITEGIPPSEHLEYVEPVEALPAVEPARTLATTSPWVFRVLFGFVVLLVLGAFTVGMSTVLTPPPTDLHMGLSNQAWSEYRAGERAVPPLVNPVPFNPFLVVTPFES